MAHQTFGEYVKERRLQRRITLREFCGKISMDPSNYSRIERGLEPPPAAASRIHAMAHVLGFKVDGEECKEMIRLADIGRGHIPRSILSNEQIAQKLPVFFRTIDRDQVDESVMDRLIEAVKSEFQ